MVQPKTKTMPANKSAALKSQTSFVIAVMVCLITSMPVFAESMFKEDAIEYRMQGYKAQQKGMLKEALNCYQKAAIIWPTYVCAYNDIGITYEMLGQIDAAEEAYLKAISIDPGYVNTYANLALLYERKNDYLLAAKYWIRRAYSGSPYDPWVRKAQDRIYEIGRIIPAVRELYISRELPQAREDESSVSKVYFENPDKFFEERLSGRNESEKAF